MYSQTVGPTPPARTDVGRRREFATDRDRPLSTPGTKLQNRGPRVRILPPLPSASNDFGVQCCAAWVGWEGV